MKRFRFWLLVVLAAMLPLRGAMAAAMLCAPAAPVEVRMSHDTAHGPSMAHDHGHEAMPEHAVHDATHDTHDHASHDKCTMCSAFCSATPLLSASPDLPALPPTGTATYPPLDAPVPTFQSDGQERPPRSI